MSNYKDSFGQPKPTEQAIAARLTAIAERLKRFDRWDYEQLQGDCEFLLAHVETLTQQVAELKGWSDAFRDKAIAERERADLAEQQRDAAHAALEKARFEIQQLEIVVPAHLDGEELFNRNGDYIYRENVLELVDAALAASAPQKGK